MTLINDIHKEFDYLHEVLASERESYVWAIAYVRKNVIDHILQSKYHLNSGERKALDKRAEYLEKKIQFKEPGQEIKFFQEELSVLRKINLREQFLNTLRHESDT